MLLTFVVPVGNYHEAIAERAIASILAQSVPCAAVVVYDRDSRGAGWARNSGLQFVETPFVAFLDADDWIHSAWAKKTLHAYDGKHYVYTDHQQEDGKVVTVSDTAWDGREGWHVITALLPTVRVRDIGGFDEELPGVEDTDFYWKLTRSGVWGKRLAQPLFYYGKQGRRAQAFRDRSDRDAISARIMQRYEGYPMTEGNSEDCGGCGANPNLPSLPTNEMQAGDVLALALWRGNRNERGRITGRIYRGGWQKPLWVAPQDVDAAPQLFSRVVEMPPPISDEDIEAFTALTDQLGAVMGNTMPTVRTPLVEDGSVVEIKPDVDKLLTLYKRQQLTPGAYIPTDFFP